MPANLNRRNFIGASGAAFALTLLAGCGNKAEESTTEDQPTEDAASTDGIDYMALVNKQHALPEGWEDALEIVHFTNTEEWDVDVEAKAYEAYLSLKEDLEKDDVFVDLDSAYRSVAEQQRIVDDFTEKYGEEYVKKYVAVPGYSEHHTGLALDLFLIIDGKGVYLNEEMVTYPEIWDKIHAKLADYGFILRYLPGKKMMTGYSYEPWHIRYLDSPEIAREIYAAGITLEEYLDEVDPVVAGCEVNYGSSELYSESDMDGALDAILTEFKTWTGCVMKRFAYAGDEAAAADLAYVNELRESQEEELDEFTEAIVFETDFHSPSEADAEGTAWDADTDYVGWTWHLGRANAEDAWHLMTWGYA